MDQIIYRAICAVFIGSGGILTFIAAIIYGKLLAFAKENVYNSKSLSTTKLSVVFFILAIFAICYLVGFILLFFNEIHPFIIFISVIFFLGGTYILSAVFIQYKMVWALQRKTAELIHSLIKATEMKDLYTRGHSEHVYLLCKSFYEYLPYDIKHRINKNHLFTGAILHDIGKISIDDAVLKKPGKLDDNDWKQMRLHPIRGKEMLMNTTFEPIGDIIAYHHERIDGNGYYRLSNEEIPIESKIISIADTYSALVTDRVYRTKLSHERAIEIMEEALGTHLDQLLFEYFKKIPKRKLFDLKHLIGDMELTEEFVTLEKNSELV